MREGRAESAGGRAGATLARVAVLLLAVAAALQSVPAAAQVKGLYFKEAGKDGRVYVFNTPEKYKLWQAAGDMGTSITLIGFGPNGETVVAENETAIDLYAFRHNLPAWERPTPEPAKPVATYPQVKIGGTWYLSYQDGESSGVDYSKFVIKRGYISVDANISSFMSARITPDITQDSAGDIKVRLKYAYAKFHKPSLGYVTRPNVEVGVVHMPWLDFEEHINAYRMQDTMFMERNGLFNSADFGVTFAGLLGQELPEDYQKTVSKAYPGRRGSFAIGVYNGGGYHASEKNSDKPIEGRLSYRPFPDSLPGLQLSYFGIRGKGNTEAEPDWDVDALMASWESRYLVTTGTWYDGAGNQKGDAVDAHGDALDRDGWSVFAEGRLHPRWSVIARYDRFDPNKAVEQDDQVRTIAGVAFHLGKGNSVLLDYDVVDFEKAGKPDDSRIQLTLPVKY
jgi:hypothetical protein